MSSFLRLGHFLRNYEKLYKLWNLGHAYILKSKGQTYVQFWDLTFLRFTDFCRVFLRLGHFLRTIRARAMKLGPCIHLEE